jgi:hypothetical protein
MARSRAAKKYAHTAPMKNRNGALLSGALSEAL